jgi:hypothetical protein
MKALQANPYVTATFLQNLWHRSDIIDFDDDVIPQKCFVQIIIVKIALVLIKNDNAPLSLCHH